MDWIGCKRAVVVACLEVLFRNFPPRIQKSRNLGRNFLSVPWFEPVSFQIKAVSLETSYRLSQANDKKFSPLQAASSKLIPCRNFLAVRELYCVIVKCLVYLFSDSELIYRTPCILLFCSNPLLFQRRQVYSDASTWQLNAACIGNFPLETLQPFLAVGCGFYCFFRLSTTAVMTEYCMARARQQTL